MRRPWRRSRYGLVFFLFASLLLASSILRLGLFLKFGAESNPTLVTVLKMLLVGLHHDFVVASMLTLPLLFWFWIFPERWFSRSWHRCLLFFGAFLFWTFEVFVLIAEYYFFDEFKSRFNTVAVDYVLYPYEVFVNLWQSYPIPGVVAICAGLSLAWVVFAARLFRNMWDESCAAGTRFFRFGAVLAVAVTLSFTVSLKGARVSSDRKLNELANNGLIALAGAAWTHNLDYSAFYKTLPGPEAYERVRRLLRESNTEFSEEGQSIRRHISGDASRPQLNVAIFLEESFGSEFWGCLGRQQTLTPEMDKLATTEGMLFTNIYACGNRTVRGFEGVLSSFPPLPGDSIVKRDRSENVETIARILKRDGYSTVFLYGGRGIFDGMRSYAVRNGYDRFIERKDFARPTFTTAWGVCDEDLFARGVEELRTLSATGKPFLATFLSVSNHKPFTFPTGRISEKPGRRETAVKYSDYALGQFFNAARKEPFWTNTIFVVVADHGARVYGSQSIPIHSYEIPLVILGPAAVKEPARLGQLGCSLDVSPTVLGLLGRPYESLFFGRDLLNSQLDGRAFMHHNRDIGMLAKNRLVGLGLRQTEEFYEGDPKKVEMQPLRNPRQSDRELQQDAIAVFQVADDLYMHHRYRIDGVAPRP